MSIIAHYKSHKFTKKYPHTQSIYHKSGVTRHKKKLPKYIDNFFQYAMLNYNYSAAGASATSVAGASASALGAALRERRVRPCFLADFSFNMFSL